MPNQPPSRTRSPLHHLTWWAPLPETREVRVGERAEVHVNMYATDGETAFTQRINTTAKQVYVGEAPLDTSAPWRGPGFPLATVGDYRDTDRTRAFSQEIWQERFG